MLPHLTGKLDTKEDNFKDSVADQFDKHLTHHVEGQKHDYEINHDAKAPNHPATDSVEITTVRNKRLIKFGPPVLIAKIP
jgi:hypothetical protein